MNREEEARFRLLAVGSLADDHSEIIAAASPFLKGLAAANGFEVDVTLDPESISDANLERYEAFLMLQLAPFDMTGTQQAALQRFIESGKGWIGLHAAGLTGREFIAPSTPYWEWFESFLGGVVYRPHAQYQRGTVVVEDHGHPVTQGLPASFEIEDEWYEFDKSPRGSVRVLATADESTYRPHQPMGDHPLIWVNEAYRRMIYIAIGHDSKILASKPFTDLLRNAILWAGT